MKTFTYSLFFLFLLPFAPAAAMTNTLTPDAVVQMALAHNPALKGLRILVNSATCSESIRTLILIISDTSSERSDAGLFDL